MGAANSASFVVILLLYGVDIVGRTPIKVAGTVTCQSTNNHGALKSCFSPIDPLKNSPFFGNSPDFLETLTMFP